MSARRHVEDLLTLLDPGGLQNGDGARRLAALGLALPAGEGFSPSNAGWRLLAETGAHQRN